MHIHCTSLHLLATLGPYSSAAVMETPGFIYNVSLEIRRRGRVKLSSLKEF